MLTVRDSDLLHLHGYLLCLCLYVKWWQLRRVWFRTRSTRFDDVWWWRLVKPLSTAARWTAVSRSFEEKDSWLWWRELVMQPTCIILLLWTRLWHSGFTSKLLSKFVCAQTNFTAETHGGAVMMSRRLWKTESLQSCVELSQCRWYIADSQW